MPPNRDTVRRELLQQIDLVLDRYSVILDRIGGKELDRVTVEEYAGFTSAALAVMERVAGPDSEYSRQAREYLAAFPVREYHLPYVAGVLKSLRDDLLAGAVESSRELVLAEVYADLLQSARGLCHQRHPTDAVLVAVGVLESHVRQACRKHGVELETLSILTAKPRTAAQLCDELAARGPYSQMDRQFVAGWLELRERVLSDRGACTREEAATLVEQVHDFVTRRPC